jgi:hypothetical protein
MAKLYYPNGDELQGAKPLNEQLWFPRHQPQLLRLANTNEGRDILCIDSFSTKPYPIVEIQKNFVKYFRGTWNGRHHFTTDFRVGAKWGNVIRYRWLEFKAAMNHQTLLDIMRWPTMYDSVSGRWLLPVGGGTELIVFPDAHDEDTTVDGETMEGTNANWATIRGDGGEAASPSTTTMIAGIGTAGGLGTTWNRVFRSAMLFLTSSIGNGTIDDATLSIVYSNIEDSLTPAGSCSIVTCTPASDTNLVPGDYAQFQTTKQASDKTLQSLNTDGSTYNAYTLNATGEGNVNGSGVSKFATVATQDNDNSEPTSGNGDNRAIATTADASGTSTDPKLVVNYTAVFTPKVIMF